MTYSDPRASLGLNYLKVMSVSLLRDTFSGRSHSNDFAYARGDYLRVRVMVISVLFIGLLPFWAFIDWLMLPREMWLGVGASRALMAGLLVSAYMLARHSRTRLTWSRLSAGIVLATPATFYALILASVPEHSEPLLGYNFIPYMLVAMLAIFPFTLVESAALGTAFLALEAYALHASELLWTGAGAQAVWLLAALLSIAMTANYFQLGLMLRLYREATHDPLTGLLNRGALIRSMKQLTLMEHPPVMYLLMMDLDHFKRINDEHGHAFGDDVLQSFAKILQETLRPQDMAARYGGEEFVAVLFDPDKDTAMHIAEAIRLRAEAAHIDGPRGKPVSYTVSIGVASLEPGDTFERSIVRADTRLYEAKASSRNCVVGV
jgi:diguanylate cyclase (GGDEF) domain